MDELLEKLKKDPLVYYIYQTDLSVFGLDDNPEYTIVVDNNYNFKKDNSKFTYFTLQQWFDLIENNVLITWICSCLDKKYITKEYVKIRPICDALKLRKSILEQLKYSDYNSYPELEDCLSDMKMDIIGLNLVNQIIENHKIVNFKSPLKDWNSIIKCNEYYPTLNKYKEIINKGLEILHKNTDDLYKQDLINKKLKEE